MQVSGEFPISGNMGEQMPSLHKRVHPYPTSETGSYYYFFFISAIQIAPPLRFRPRPDSKIDPKIDQKMGFDPEPGT